MKQYTDINHIPSIPVWSALWNSTLIPIIFRLYLCGQHYETEHWYQSYSLHTCVVSIMKQYTDINHIPSIPVLSALWNNTLISIIFPPYLCGQHYETVHWYQSYSLHTCVVSIMKQYTDTNHIPSIPVWSALWNNTLISIIFPPYLCGQHYEIVYWYQSYSLHNGVVSIMKQYTDINHIPSIPVWSALGNSTLIAIIFPQYLCGQHYETVLKIIHGGILQITVLCIKFLCSLNSILLHMKMILYPVCRH